MIATVYAVFADAAEAERIARDMVERRLAACANVMAPCRSIYRWQDIVQAAEEVPALFKVARDGAPALMAAIAAAHSYDVPAVTCWPADALPDYAAWVAAS